MKYTFQLLTALLISWNVFAQTPALTVPDFTFFKFNKTPFTNKNLEPGKMIFFVFFDAGCEHCQHAVQTLNMHYSDLKNTSLYLISLDNEQTINNFMNRYGNNLSGKKNVVLLQDLNNEFISKFGPRKYPSMFLYSSEKKLMLYNDNEENLFRFFQQMNEASKRT
jgi:peroxiredoxin